MLSHCPKCESPTKSIQDNFRKTVRLSKMDYVDIKLCVKFKVD